MTNQPSPASSSTTAPKLRLAGDADPGLDRGSTEHAYAELRNKVLVGELAPGATFSQVQLSEQLGVSRTPLREAIRRLQTEGLLSSERGRRVRVAPLTTDDFEDLYAMRIVLDSLAVRLTIPLLTEDELTEIRMAYLEATAAANRGDVAAYLEPHRRFHFGLFAHAGARLEQEVDDLWDHAERYRRLQLQHADDLAHLVRLGEREHAAILEAAEKRDAGLGARRMAEHLSRTALMTLVQIDHRYEPVRIRAALDHVYAQSPTP
jgi:DNA-binding GntR family transcriptional regulator